MSESGMKELIGHAESVRAVVELRNGGSSGTVGAALRSSTGEIYTGVCIELACGLGICAEHAAIADMLKNQETEVTEVVAVGPNGVIAPCGKCRELILQLSAGNVNASIALPSGSYVRLGDLLPEHWLRSVR